MNRDAEFIIKLLLGMQCSTWSEQCIVSVAGRLTIFELKQCDFEPAALNQ